MFTTGKGADYVAEKQKQQWLVISVGDGINELGYNHMFADMFNAIENKPNRKKHFTMATWWMPC